MLDKETQGLLNHPPGPGAIEQTSLLLTVSTYTWANNHMHIHANTSPCMCMDINTHGCKHLHIHTHISTHTCLHEHAHRHKMHTPQMHTHAHAHTHTCTLKIQKFPRGKMFSKHRRLACPPAHRSICNTWLGDSEDEVNFSGHKPTTRSVVLLW